MVDVGVPFFTERSVETVVEVVRQTKEKLRRELIDSVFDSGSLLDGGRRSAAKRVNKIFEEPFTPEKKAKLVERLKRVRELEESLDLPGPER